MRLPWGESARKFCTDPISNISDSERKGLDESLSALSVITSLAVGTTSSASTCEKLAKINEATTVANLGFAATCKTKKMQCTWSCGEALKILKAADQDLINIEENGLTVTNLPDIEYLAGEYRKLDSNNDEIGSKDKLAGANPPQVISLCNGLDALKYLNQAQVSVQSAASAHL